MLIESTSYGFYVDLEKTHPGDLAIVLNETGREEFETIEFQALFHILVDLA
jgi:hypothetical protein